MLRFRAWGPYAVLVACTVAFADPPTPGPAARRVAPLSPEALVEVMQAERDAYSRRLDVCTQLRRIAIETNDPKLEAEALQLEQLAETTYKQRVAKLGVKSDARPSAPSLLERNPGSKPTDSRSDRPALAPSRDFRVVNP